MLVAIVVLLISCSGVSRAFDDVINIRPGEMYTFITDMDKGEKVTFSIESYGHPIDFGVMNTENYMRLMKGENEVPPLKLWEGVTQAKGLTFKAPRGGSYYFLISNQNYDSPVSLNVQSSIMNTRQV